MTRPPRLPVARRATGYTIVELMMALAVLAVSVSGVIAMQKVTIVSNRQARDVALANRIAQAWVEQLHVDATLWNHPSDGNGVSDIGDTTWLNIDAAESHEFKLPGFSTTRIFGPGFDAFGRPQDHTIAANQGSLVFCTHLQVQRLTPNTSTHGLRRVTIRVFWRRYGWSREGDAVPGHICSEDPTTVGNAARQREFHSVYVTTVIAQNTAP